MDKSVEQQIVARLTEAVDLEDMPSLPRWIERLVDRGEVERALRFVKYLNEAEDSPWKSKIRMANSDSENGTINQKSFVRHVVKYVLTANNPISIYSDFDREKKIFSNYWKAVVSLLDDGDSDTLYKTNGVELFCQFSIPFFLTLQERKDFKVSTMQSLLKGCLDNVEGDYAGVGHPDWWKTGGQAGRLNSGALTIVSRDMTKALRKSAGGGEIEI